MYYIIDDNGTEVSHDILRISDYYTLGKLLKEAPHINEHMAHDIINLVWNHNASYWEFKGDGGELGFILDVWDDKEEDIIESYQFWFEDY